MLNGHANRQVHAGASPVCMPDICVDLLDLAMTWPCVWLPLPWFLFIVVWLGWCLWRYAVSCTCLLFPLLISVCIGSPEFLGLFVLLRVTPHVLPQQQCRAIDAM